MEDFYRKIINGMTILFEKRKLPIASIVNAVKFGSAYEQPKFKGIAHFIEHALFKGTSKRTQEQIAKEIEKRGGSLNGFTEEELTAYIVKLPSKHAFLGLDILTDLTTNPLFDEKEIEKEKNVILEEIRLKHDTPSAFILMKSKELLYKKPFSMSALGTKENIARMKRKDLVSFFNKYYLPSNSIISVVGDMDISEFKKLKFNKKGAAFKKIAPIKINKSVIEKRKGLHQAHLALSFHAPTLKEKDRYAVEAFNCMLGEGMSSRLFQEIREKYGLAYAVKSFYEQGTDYGYVAVYIGTKKENVGKVKEIVLKEIKKMQHIEKNELEEAKEQLIGERSVQTEESSITAVCLLQEELAGNAEEFYNYTDRINSIKLEDIRKLSKIKSYSFAALVPK